MNNRNIKPISPFITFCQKVIPLAFDESMSYYECLCAMLKHIQEMDTAVNLNADAVTELQNYVANYFKNLDVQEEINNKLDEMAESGQLAEIIAIYINSNTVLGFNTVNDLVNSETIVNGSFTRTFGELNYNDGKGAFYKIRNITSSDVVDGVNIIKIETSDILIAEKMSDYYINLINENIAQINENLEEITPQINEINEKVSNLNSLYFDYDIIVDIEGNGDYTSLTDAVSNATTGDKIFIRNGEYNDEIVNCYGKKLTVVGESAEGVIIQNSLDDYTRPPLNVGKGYFENITFKQNSNSGNQGNHSYAIHIDNNDLFNETLTFKNCNMFSHSSAGVGIGTYNNCKLSFIGCTITSDSNDDTNKIGAFFIHNAPNTEYQGSNQYCIIKDCVIISKYQSAMHFRYCGPANNMLFVRCLNSQFVCETSIFIYKGVVTYDSINGNIDNIYIDNRSCGNNIEVLNRGLYDLNHTSLTGLFAKDTLNNQIKRKVLSAEIGIGTSNIPLNDTLTTLVDIKCNVLNNGVWFPLNVHSADNVTIVSTYVFNNHIQIDSTITGNVVIIIDYV